MMAVIAISTPEAIILRKVLKPRLIGVFIGVVTVGIIFVGYLFNIRTLIQNKRGGFDEENRSLRCRLSQMPQALRPGSGRSKEAGCGRRSAVC